MHALEPLDLPDLRHASDDALMAQLCEGAVDESLTELRRRYRPRVFRLAQSILRDAHLAEDACEQVFEKVYFKARLYQPGTRFIAWLLEVTRNQALSILRANRSLPRPVSTMAVGGPDSEDDNWFEVARGTYEDQLAEEHELMEKLERAVDALPDHYRLPFQLCVRDGQQYREAAEALGIPTGTVAIRIMRARKRLFRELADCLGSIRRPPACFTAA